MLDLGLSSISVRQLADDHYVILEFVKGDSPSRFIEDAQALKARIY